MATATVGCKPAVGEWKERSGTLALSPDGETLTIHTVGKWQWKDGELEQWAYDGILQCVNAKKKLYMGPIRTTHGSYVDRAGLIAMVKGTMVHCLEGWNGGTGLEHAEFSLPLST
jgi:hypothetical protein